MKVKVLYRCTECSYEAGKWEGRCSQCQAWGSLQEAEKQVDSSRDKKIKAHARTPKEFADVIKSIGDKNFSVIGIEEVDRVLGGGIVDGSLILLTGEPGIGKSTLTLQIADEVSQKNKRVLYITGEETEEQVSLRGKRLGLKLDNLHLLSEQNLETIIATAETHKPDLLIIDSIQVIGSKAIPGGAGATSQVRFCTEQILEFAKPRKIPVLIIGHVTKDGTLAGPRSLEHLVDTVLYFEGSRNHELRMLRAVKNRYGSTQEVGILQMGEKGLAEITDLKKFFIEHRGSEVVGGCLTATIEGTRPIIIEVQALTNKTVFGYPKRTASGFDINRLNVLLAVLERHCGARLSEQDVYINVVSGYRIDDPGCDLGVCLAILSSLYKKAIPQNIVACGEIGLSGEIRSSKNSKRVESEIKKMELLPFFKEKSLAGAAQTLFRANK